MGRPRILALAGGVGGAKLAAGLADALPPGDLAVVVNTGDDFVHLGLSISPDLDTVTYTLAGLNDSARGWGLAGETWEMMQALERLGGETWFRLGDRDLATHLERSRRLAAGEALSDITADVCARLGVTTTVWPMTDDPVRTMVETGEGVLAFQDYFVRRQCKPSVYALRFDGAEHARPNSALLALLQSAALEAIILCPSNPFLSIGPLLAMPPLREALSRRTAPLVAVSPIIGGRAVKGPAAKMMAELGLPPSASTVEKTYGDLIDGFVLDRRDKAERVEIACPTFLTDILMRNRADQKRLAQETLLFAESLR